MNPSEAMAGAKARLGGGLPLALPVAICALAVPVPPWQAALLGSLALALRVAGPRRAVFLGLAADELALAVAAGLVAALEAQRSLAHGVVLLVVAAVSGVACSGTLSPQPPLPALRERGLRRDGSSASARLLEWAGLLAAAFWMAAPLVIQRVAAAGSPPRPRATQMLLGLVFAVVGWAMLRALGSGRGRLARAGGHAALGLLALWAALGFTLGQRASDLRLLSCFGWEPFLAQHRVAEGRSALSRGATSQAAESFWHAVRLGAAPAAFLEMAYAHEVSGEATRAHREIGTVLAQGFRVEDALAIPYPGPLASLGQDLAVAGRSAEAAVAFEGESRRTPDAWVLARLADELRRSGRPLEARHAYEQAMGRGELARGSCGLALLPGASTGEAERCLRAVQDHLGARVRLGQAQRAGGREVLIGGLLRLQGNEIAERGTPDAPLSEGGRAQRERRSIGVSLRFEVVEPGIAEPMTVYLAAVGPSVFQGDHDLMERRRPPPSWIPGEELRDDFEIQVPAEAPPGRYRVLTALYRPGDLSRLALTMDGRRQDGDAIEIGSFEVRP